MVLRSRISPDIFLHIPPIQANPSCSRNFAGEEDAGGSVDVQQRNVHLVFLVTGNPGLIGYYHPFLSRVVDLLSLDDDDGGGDRDDDGGDADDNTAVKRPDVAAVVVVAGFSLGGFQVEDYHSTPSADKLSSQGKEDGQTSQQDDNMRRLLMFPASWPSVDSAMSDGRQGQERHTRKIYSLQEQIALCYARLENLVQQVTAHVEQATRTRTTTTTTTSRQDDEGRAVDLDVHVKVTLMGHSVGAYIALEMVRLRHEQKQRYQESRLGATTTTMELGDALSKSASTEETWSSDSWSVGSCILLTPTIQDLHLSSSGRIATPLLTAVPLPLPKLLQSLVSGVLVAGLPRSWLRWLVQRATGMAGGSHGMETTVTFLTSPTGVRQALDMARCELLEIRKEKWGDEVWGVASQQCQGDEIGIASAELETSTPVSPNLFFWFAKHDHWVADVTRDELFKQRSQGGGEGLDCSFRQVGDDDDSTLDGQARQSKTRFRIDETDGLVHAWCLTQSDLVAKRVSRWLRELS